MRVGCGHALRAIGLVLVVAACAQPSRPTRLAQEGCDPVRLDDTIARIRKPVTRIYFPSSAAPVLAGTLDTSDLVRITGHAAGRLHIAAPIGADDGFSLSSADVCRVTAVVLPDSLYPVPYGGPMSPQFAALGEGARIAPWQIAQLVERSGKDGGPTSGRAVSVEVIKYYVQVGLLLPSAVGWYDVANVAYEVSARGFEVEIGSGSDVLLRQGQDARSRRLLVIEDVADQKAPMVIYAGSTNVERTVVAIQRGGGGQWLTYECSTRGITVRTRSPRDDPAVRQALTVAALSTCR